MKETMNPIAAVTAAALGVLSAYMVQLFIPPDRAGDRHGGGLRHGDGQGVVCR